MNKLKIKLHNCYGIKKIEHDFDFSDQSTYAIYAPNGAMKTSLAKTFQDIQLNTPSKDLIFPERINLREVTKEDGEELTPEEIFVIEPYRGDFNSEKISTLLANKELKKRYDAIHVRINEGKNNLINALKSLPNLPSDIEKEISESFIHEFNNKSFLVSLKSAEERVLDKTEPIYSEICYKEIFNPKVLALLETKDFQIKVADYIKKYDELIAKSRYFKKGVFNHNNAASIAKNLVENGFFDAKHSVSLHGGGSDNKIDTKEALEEIINEEKSAILNDPDLINAFNDVDKALQKNSDVRKFRDHLANHEEIIPELKNLDGFRQKIWVSYLKVQKELYSTLLQEYDLGKKELDEIADKAKHEKTIWQDVINIFNKRFSVPFELEMKNQEDVILTLEVPSIAFIFKDYAEEATIEEKDLLKVLSNGEKRALYILNIIFEIEARKKALQPSLFIIDDIADSFDYKNKYAIIEYLKEVSQQVNFRQLILTHNFDFFRTIQSRLSIRQDTYCLMIKKTADKIELVKAEYFKPFKYFITHLENEKVFVASIPFARNIVEYTRGTDDPNYSKLTSILHFNPDTSKTTTIKDIIKIYKNIFPNQENLNLKNEDDFIFDKIFTLADGCLSAYEGINLENKLILSIAIRIQAEKYMFDMLTNKSMPRKNQTRIFFDRFKKEFNTTKPGEIETLDQVNLMTPENIHLNSFMYEPILDMSDEHLKRLYQNIKAL